MRMVLMLMISGSLVAVMARPTQAFYNADANLPVPGRMNAQAYNPNVPHWPIQMVQKIKENHAWHPWHGRHSWHNHPHHQPPYPMVAFPTMPGGCGPSEPPCPPFPQPCYGCQSAMLPTAPDLLNPGPYGVLPWHPPFQGMLLAPAYQGGQGGTSPSFAGIRQGPGGPGGPGGGPGVFGHHPFARSPRDFFMAGQ